MHLSFVKTTITQQKKCVIKILHAPWVGLNDEQQPWKFENPCLKLIYNCFVILMLIIQVWSQLFYENIVRVWISVEF